ncbi:MAG: phosphoenolpyruvate--protein phosphotransferase [Oscillospiraceae bacterium]|nr:phosphoenolpyruvate--protein phosphotransferase [Oscillospiraceae bacterium]
MIALRGTGISSGIASGPVVYYRRTQTQTKRTSVQDTDEAVARWQAATQTAISQLEELSRKARAEVGEEAAQLFETHQMMLGDLDYTERITSLIRDDHLNPEAAVEDAGKEFAQMFSAMDDEYMKARSVDVLDISSRVVRILSNCDDKGITGKTPVIIAADELKPSETVQLDKSMILGFILTGGNANSHTAILARSLGIPAIINVDGPLRPEYEGRTAIIDGSIGYIVIDPDESTKEYMSKKKREEKALRTMLEQLKGQPDDTLDGKHIKVYANITTPSDTDSVITNDACGIGLFRSEFLYLRSSDYPTENAQFEAYKSVVQKMNGAPVIIRTLDIGADKHVDYFRLEEERNPALGMRALRICLTRPEIFKTQLRALYRASAFGKLSIMFPMVTSLWEVQEAKRICSAVRSELKKERIQFDENVELGVMIETPASVMIALELAKEVSFFSIGTNDLTQYTIAIDRESTAGLEKFYDAHHPAVMRLIDMTVKAGHDAGIWVGICGEIAADVSLTESFLRMGVDELSVSPRAVLPVRNAVRSVNLSK